MMLVPNERTSENQLQQERDSQVRGRQAREAAGQLTLHEGTRASSHQSGTRSQQHTHALTRTLTHSHTHSHTHTLALTQEKERGKVR